MKHVVIFFLALLPTACASQAELANDAPAMPYSWCLDQARDAASQPLSRDASHAERQAVRDYHVSKACQQATQKSVKVAFPRRTH